MVLVGAVLSSIWRPLLIAAVLAASLYRWHERLATLLRQHRAISALIVTLGVVVLILLPLTAIGVIAVREMLTAITHTRDALEAGGVRELISRLPSPAREWAAELLELLAAGTSTGVDQVTSGARAAAGALTGAVSTTTTMVIDLTLTLIGLYFFLIDGHRLVAWIERTTPLPAGQTHELLVEFRVTARSVLGSTLITAAAQATMAAIGYLIAGVPQVVFFSLLTFFAAFIPSVGTGIVALPLVGLLAITGHPWRALFLAIYALVVVGLVDNLTKPLLMKGELRLHGAIVFFALLGGIFEFGAVGLLVGPLAVAFLVAMLRIAKRPSGEPRAAGGSGSLPAPPPRSSNRR